MKHGFTNHTTSARDRVLAKLGDIVIYPIDTPVESFQVAEKTPWALPGQRIVSVATLRKIARDNKVDFNFFWTTDRGIL